jgi:hypothetical protein
MLVGDEFKSRMIKESVGHSYWHYKLEVGSLKPNILTDILREFNLSWQIQGLHQLSVPRAYSPNSKTVEPNTSLYSHRQAVVMALH